MRQVIINIVSNAIKFTQPEGSVGVSATIKGGGDLVVKITDTGIGMDEAVLPTVIEPFVQVESALSRENGGLGLGLPLVKKITELHGGELEIQSKLGEGTTVLVHLPKERVIEGEKSAQNQIA